MMATQGSCDFNSLLIDELRLWKDDCKISGSKKIIFLWDRL